MLEVGGIQGISTNDFPKEVASTIFLAGCNFRCPYCQNKSLVLMEDWKFLSIPEIIQQLQENKLLLTGVCISGGEPLMQGQFLINLLSEIRKLNLLIKIDTNGFFSNRLLKITNFIDLIAIDIKASPKKYGKAIGIESLSNKAIHNLKDSLNIAQNLIGTYELRTTIVPGLNDSEQDMQDICEFIIDYVDGVDGTYVLQQFRSDKGTLDPDYKKIHSPSYEVMKKLKKIAENYFPRVDIRAFNYK